MKEIRGIFAPIVTPFTDDDKIDYESLAFNLERLGRTKLAGIVVIGSNGEFASLTQREKIDLMKFVRAHLAPSKAMIAGTGSESLPVTKELNEAAADAGADAVLVLSPTYYKGALTPAGLTAWLTAVADASPLPVMLYNMPGNSGVNIPPAVTVALSQHPNVAGIKDSGGVIAQIAQVAHQARPGFAVFAGSGSFLMPTLLAGGVGGTLAVANIAPDYCVELAERALSGDIPDARRMQGELIPLNGAVTSKWGVPGLKCAMAKLGWKSGRLRLPFLPLGAEAERQLAETLETFQSRTGYDLHVV